MKPLPIPAEKPVAAAKPASTGKAIKIVVAVVLLIAAGVIYWTLSRPEEQVEIKLPDATNNNTPQKPANANSGGGRYWIEDPKNPVKPK